MLIVSGLSKSFGVKRAVSNVSFEVAMGEVFCMLGPNGAGKTTTLSMLLGFEQPDAGSASFNGKDLWHERESCRSQLMYVPENVSLYPEFTALENIEYFAALSHIKVTADEVAAALTSAGFDISEARRPARHYSKGMRQKVVIAFSLLKDAKLLLLDEPTSGLDPTATRDFIELVQKLKHKGAAVVIITHDLQCAHLVADRIGILCAGELVQVLNRSECSLNELADTYFSAA